MQGVHFMQETREHTNTLTKTKHVNLYLKSKNYQMENDMRTFFALC